jgi:hypothetical protein
LLYTGSDLDASKSGNVAVELSPASFSYTGSNLGAVTGRKAVLSPASLLYTGSNLDAKTGRKAALSPASLLYTGSDLDVAAPTNNSVELSPASFSYTGSSLTASPTSANQQPPSHGSRKGFRERKRFYDPERWLREWQKTEEELRADIEAIEAAQIAAREAAEASKEKKQRKLKVAALERSLKSLDLETDQLRSELLALKAAAYAKEMADIQSGLEAMMEEARAAEQTLMKLRRDEEAMAFLLLAEI